MNLTLEGHPPIKNPPLVASGYDDDYIKNLGDKIAALSDEQFKELYEYLEYMYGIN